MQSEQQGNKVPDKLKEIEGSIESIFQAMNGPAVGAKEGGGQQGGQGKQGGQSQEGKQPQASTQGNQAAPQDPWGKVDPIINKLHYSWNDYMAQAVKAGASKTLIGNFDTALNSLTNSIISKNKTNTLMGASHLYSYIPDFYSLYRSQTSPEIKRIRYYARDAMLNSMTPNWPQAEADIESLKSSWSLCKSTIPKEQQDAGNRLDFSIYQLESVIKEKNQPLTDIKGKVALTNIESLEKAIEEQANRGGGNAGGTSSAGVSVGNQ
jgi:hypothetical protein